MKKRIERVHAFKVWEPGMSNDYTAVVRDDDGGEVAILILEDQRRMEEFNVPPDAAIALYNALASWMRRYNASENEPGVGVLPNEGGAA